MIKRIIFDVDNTLLNTNKDCEDAYRKFFIEKFGKDYSKELYDLIEDYDKVSGSYEVEDLIKYVSENAPFEYREEDFKDTYAEYRKHATLMEACTPEVLKELSKKYEIVALTNWYYIDQKARLEKAGIAKYFTEIYAFENAGLKPNPKVYNIARGTHEFNECLFVGDSISKDVIAPEKEGMKAVWYNPNKEEGEYLNIQSLKELTSLLEGGKL